MSAPDVQATPAIETDAEGLRDDERNGWKSAAQAVRREFLCDVVVRVATAAPGGLFAGWSGAEAWDIAEDLYREGQRRGYLP